MVLDQGTLDDIVRRIVEVAQPEKIILFGSARPVAERDHEEAVAIADAVVRWGGERL